MKTHFKKIKRAFTLVEMTLVLMIGMAIGSMLLVLMNQQLAFINLFRSQNFLIEEAPIISTHISKLLIHAERFRLHESLDDALSGANPRLTDSPVLVLNFRQPDGTIRAGILSFEDRGSGDALYYYVVPTSGALADPEWAVTTKPTDVNFYMDSGVIRIRITGPAMEELTFSGDME
ncbi:MAG: hypothetical protein ACSHX7_03165 [Luteolibacter sp.]